MFVTYSINRGMYLHTLFFEFNFDTALLNISKRVQRMAGPSRRAGVLSPPTPVSADALLRATVSRQMLALGELEFHRVFLIHVYLAG